MSKRKSEQDAPSRPKKRFKKQLDYHSSSDEEDNDQIAKDAPRKSPPLKSSSSPALKRQSRPLPKSILKPGKQPIGPDKDSGDGEDEQEDLEHNTALNSVTGVLGGAEDGDDDEMFGNSEAQDPADDEPELGTDGDVEDEDEETDDAESETSLTSSQTARAKRKRNDPTAFATSISKILDTKLSTAKRADPVLSRSKSASEANRVLADQKLEQKARAQIRTERKQALERGRVKDVLGLETEGVDTGLVIEEEKLLKKIAQKGVVRLFNAVRTAQVKAEEARAQARKGGVVGVKQREEMVNEMSKEGFLDLISSGGKKLAAS